MNRLGDKVPVEPLAPERVQRIEQQVLSAAAAGEPFVRWRWAPAAVGVAVAASIAVAVWWVAAPREVAPETRAAARATTSPGSVAVVGDARIELGEQTRAEIATGEAGAIAVVLHAGRVQCEVPRRAGRPPFAVIAGDVRVDVVGTVFAVTRDGDEVVVEVMRGQVRVSRRGEEVAIVAAGGRTRVGPMAGTDTETQPGTETERGTQTETTDAEAEREPGAESDAEIEGPAGAQAATAAQAAAAVAGSSVGTARRPPRPRRGELPPVVQLAAVSDPALSRARALEADDPAQAMRIYQAAFSDGSGARAEYAAYALAYLEYVHRGRGRDAIRWADRYQRRFSRGRYLEQAVWLRVHALYALGDDAACRAAAHTYLRLRPNDPARVAAAKRLTATQ